MRSELTTCRTFGIVHGEDFFASFTEFYDENNIPQGYIPMFLAAFAEAEVVGTCEKLADPNAPVWSKVHLTNAEAIGCGNPRPRPRDQQDAPPHPTSLGLGAPVVGHTSHLLSARVRSLVELVIVEVTAIQLLRPLRAQAV
ncbi:DUF296 domain-containing protein [Actinomadura fulvescens]|uniref:Uncharacterized protein n=1 Tax=Actinomadura fulvescens TaxID=46160 RepID=A0ABP6CP02_9ACTN